MTPALDTLVATAPIIACIAGAWGAILVCGWAHRHATRQLRADLAAVRASLDVLRVEVATRRRGVLASWAADAAADAILDRTDLDDTIAELFRTPPRETS